MTTHSSIKTQPWKQHWPPADSNSCPTGVEYGVQRGETVVVDGTSANVKPQKVQPWKGTWPPTSKQEDGVEYGVDKGETVVVDGTASNVKPKTGIKTCEQ